MVAQIKKSENRLHSPPTQPIHNYLHRLRPLPEIEVSFMKEAESV